MTKEALITLLVDEGYVYRKGDEFFTTNRITLSTQHLLSPKEMLEQFIKDSKIPYRIKTNNGGFYYPSMISKYSIKYFYNVRMSCRYSYEDMVTVTNKYYNDVNTLRVNLTRYFQEGLFDILMDAFLRGESPDDNSVDTGRPIG